MYRTEIDGVGEEGQAIIAVTALNGNSLKDNKLSLA